MDPAKKLKSSSEHNAKLTIFSDQVLIPILLKLSESPGDYKASREYARALARACCTCRAFNTAGSEPYLWKKLCDSGSLPKISESQKVVESLGGYKQLYAFLHPPEHQRFNLEFVLDAVCSEDFRETIFPPLSFLFLLRRRIPSAASTSGESHRSPGWEHFGGCCHPKVVRRKWQAWERAGVSASSGTAWDFEGTVKRPRSSSSFQVYEIACSKQGLIAGGFEEGGKQFFFSLVKCWITPWRSGEWEEGELLIV